MDWKTQEKRLQFSSNGYTGLTQFLLKSCKIFKVNIENNIQNLYEKAKETEYLKQFWK